MKFCGDECIRTRLLSKVCRPGGGDGGRVKPFKLASEETVQYLTVSVVCG